MVDVFVSYKAEDRRRVVPLVQALEADGLTVWWDAHIGGGVDWRDSIEEHLDAARCVVVVWSKRSVGREGRFVRDEASRAQRHRTYLPVRIDKVEPPLGFAETQAISLNDGPATGRTNATSRCWPRSRPPRPDASRQPAEGVRPTGQPAKGAGVGGESGGCGRGGRLVPARARDGASDEHCRLALREPERDAERSSAGAGAVICKSGWPGRWFGTLRRVI